MEFGAIEILLLFLASAILLFLLLWVREEAVRWWSAREHRRAIKRASERRE